MAASTSHPLTIAVDVNPATRAVVTGTESYTREVGSRLALAAPELRWRFFASRPRANLGMDVMVVPFPRLWSQVRLPAALASERPDLLFVPSHVIPFAWPGKVLTVVHDLAFMRHPQAYTFADRTYLQLTTRWAVARSRLLIAVSESTRDDLVELYGVKPDRVRVVPLGISPPSVTPASVSCLAELGLNETFVLQVGRVERRKNQVAALAAVEQLQDVTLVVAGPERDASLADQLRRSRHCRVLGRVDQPLLELLYKRAAAVIVPSLYEGFGLPVLEALVRGKVVVAAKASSLPEVGGDAALYFHPGASAEQLAGIIDVALHDQSLRTQLARLARARARIFTWEKTAAGVAAVIRELVGS
ncbi:MAG TPA: glycosyltransferase family 1 protein [Candidatus Dormibacteraeota bacterium]|nr:glycosyltransferase family 1 protein [Candidatus Dormibacteraeota bacterium]